MNNLHPINVPIITGLTTYTSATKHPKQHRPPLIPDSRVMEFRYVLFVFLVLSKPYSLIVQCQFLPVAGGGDDNHIQTYIVHIEKPVTGALLGDEDRESWHRSFLPNATLGSGEPRLLYSYRHAISGFAARLTQNEAKAMEAIPGFLHAEPDEELHLATTYTPRFLGLSQPGAGAWGRYSAGEGTIIGVLDSGINAAHPSFAADDRFPPPPTRWKGGCSHGVRCNNKLIGAAVFEKSVKDHKDLTVDDDEGHGTHVAGIAAGAFVGGAEVYGMARGVASGMAPRAHLAVYKVGKAGSDLLAGIDRAIHDGVDVINLSLGGLPGRELYRSSIAIGSMSAVRKGIVVVTVSGNSGPDENTVENSAPWFVTVGASSTDRRISSIVRLGNGAELVGESEYQPAAWSPTPSLPVAFPPDCGFRTLRDADVRGKLVLCWVKLNDNPYPKTQAVKEAGGAAAVLMNEASVGYTTGVGAKYLPAAHVSFMDGRAVRSYFYSDPAPTASIVFDGTRFGRRPSPALAAFSSRGPSFTNGGVLKPDVLAPGVNILSARPWPYDDEPLPLAPSDPSKPFEFQSGTSMAAPHVAGIAALVRSRHPDWSPAAVRSAIITSASDLDLDGNFITDQNSGLAADIFHAGAGQANASGALDPGLVYDIHPDEYVGYLCGLGYTDKQVRVMLAGDHVKCSDATGLAAGQLNYPSITWYVHPGERVVTVYRTVRNVGEMGAVYRAEISEPPGVGVDVSRSEIRFNWRQQTATFVVTLRIHATTATGRAGLRGKLRWISDKHEVTSPIAVLYRNTPPAAVSLKSIAKT